MRPRGERGRLLVGLRLVIVRLGLLIAHLRVLPVRAGGAGLLLGLVRRGAGGVLPVAGSSSDSRGAGADIPCTGQKRARPRDCRFSGSDVGSIGSRLPFQWRRHPRGGPVGRRALHLGCGAGRRYRPRPPGHTPSAGP
ncbi:hypothetical protein Aau02nite_78180 [Amorphoplanes auranticolor]|uniref:Uncharacterized protein n=1 Tax=Actinoplanes auranticolor TaxID=47988 RepID=A0A919SUL1_9ACTN|nr:hypothetical protein Aau02nite_78180 [Actinoplanes auranticolor]